jgi:predicted nucleic acid-binding protein
LIITYIDSGVLIYAAGGVDAVAKLALPFLEDINREFVTSDFVLLEVLPKAVFHKNNAEVEFYKRFFQRNRRVISSSSELIKLAMEEAYENGLAGMDALHIAAAVFGGAEELVTSEKSSKPMHRTKRVKVLSIYPPEEPT